MAEKLAPALILPSGGAWSRGELEREIDDWVRLLRRRGVGRGELVVLVAGNSPSGVALFHAAQRVGAVLAPLNARLTGFELRPLIDRIGPRLLVVEPGLESRLQGLAALVGEHGGHLLFSRPRPENEVGVDPEARAVLFTSGTTGVPKGARLSAANFEASAAASGANLGREPGQVWLACLPMFHIGGLAMAHRCDAYGATLWLQRGFEAAAVSEALDSGRVTHLSLVATGLRRLLEWRGDRPFPPSLRAVLVGGGPIGPALLERARTMGAPVLQTYGLTEACSQVATERLGQADGQSAGPALPGLELRVVGPDGAVLGAGVPGGVEVRGPTVMLGYLRDEAATRAVLLDGGWLRTGDLGTLDARGRLTLHARRTDLIVSGGENVYPAELEAVLEAHPWVREAAVVGREDGEFGQRPWAVVVLEAGSSSRREVEVELAAWCRARLAGFKVPRGFVAVDELPRTVGGKLDRSALHSLLPARDAAS